MRSLKDSDQSNTHIHTYTDRQTETQRHRCLEKRRLTVIYKVYQRKPIGSVNANRLGTLSH